MQDNSNNKLTKVRKKSYNEISDAIEKRFQSLINEGSKAPVLTDSSDIDLPSYYDPDKFYLGQQTFYNNIFTMMISKFSGLITLITIPSILNILDFTKHQSTPCMAYKRYISTILHMCVWYKKDPLKQKEFLESLKIIRKKHCIAFRRAYEAGIRKASQADMAYAQFGFIGYILLGTEQLHISATDEELQGFVHFWRVICYVLGMEDKYNLCMETVEETRALCSKVLDEVFIPNVIKYKYNYYKNGKILIDGLWPFYPILDPPSFTTLTLYVTSLITTNNNHSIEIDYDSMPLFSKTLLNIQFFVLNYLLPIKYWWSVIFRTFFNYSMIVTIYLTEHLPLLAYWTYGIKHSTINIFRHKVSE
ncbi:PREDICTED: uncharacterized protein LOC107067353 [Polistes dominula]|uniref:Uncharacterized protein LOC107067353 n=1 Tax=Polistes dominula TaxID=743375 RepID=A0ABM1IDI8_POLDO|nr:PREDICTED: uncharacterized protein LOC107067353 [Polistes dominula]